MAVEQIKRSQTFRESVWTFYGGDPLERLSQFVDARGGSTRCAFRPLGAPSSVAFDLEIASSSGKGQTRATFSWERSAGIALPSLRGSITASRFGPLVCVLVNAEYFYRGGPAGALAHQAIGGQCAARSLSYLMQFLRTIFPAAALRHGF
jgi:hypothetical protein